MTGRLQYGHSPKSRLNDWRVEGNALSHSHRHALWNGLEQPSHLVQKVAGCAYTGLQACLTKVEGFAQLSHAISGTQPSRSYM